MKYVVTKVMSTLLSYEVEAESEHEAVQQIQEDKQFMLRPMSVIRDVQDIICEGEAT